MVCRHPQFTHVSDYYHADETALEAMAYLTDSVQAEQDGDVIWFVPEDPTAGLIFYPGGKVEYIENRLATLRGQGPTCMGVCCLLDTDIAQTAKAVKMDGAVFMQLRYQYITKALAIAGIFQERHNLLQDLLRVIAGDFRSVQRPRKEEVEAVTSGDIPHSGLGTVTADFCGTLRVISFSLGRYVIETSQRLPAGLTKDWLVAYLNHIY